MQKTLLTASTSFADLGGDSLAAVRVVRALYALHHGVRDSRRLGGTLGGLEGGVFGVERLVGAESLSSYVDFLDSRGVVEGERVSNDVGGGGGASRSGSGEEEVRRGGEEGDGGKETGAESVPNDDRDDAQASTLYRALLSSIVLGQSSVACALLEEGADPNHLKHDKRIERLGKTSDRTRQRKVFRSNLLR